MTSYKGQKARYESFQWAFYRDTGKITVDVRFVDCNQNMSSAARPATLKNSYFWLNPDTKPLK